MTNVITFGSPFEGGTLTHAALGDAGNKVAQGAANSIGLSESQQREAGYAGTMAGDIAANIVEAAAPIIQPIAKVATHFVADAPLLHSSPNVHFTAAVGTGDLAVSQADAAFSGIDERYLIDTSRLKDLGHDELDFTDDVARVIRHTVSQPSGSASW